MDANPVCLECKLSKFAEVSKGREALSWIQKAKPFAGAEQSFAEDYINNKKRDFLYSENRIKKSLLNKFCVAYLAE